MSTYRIDEEACEDGITWLENYMWTKESQPDHQGNIVFRKVPAKNGAQHAADAIRQHAQGYRGQHSGFAEQLQKRSMGGGRAYARKGNNPITNPSYEHVV